MDKLFSEIDKLNLGKIDLLALVSKTSSEVVFYCDVNGKSIQSNNLIEEGLIDSVKLDTFYSSVTTIIRNDSKFKADKMNIVKINKNNDISFTYDETNCRIYGIKKEWKNNL